MNNIFVGNLSFQATKEDLIKLFEPFGSVANAVIMERKKGKSRGYGFVDMPNEEEKNAAIAALAGKEFMWRVLSVSPVIPKIRNEEKPKRFKAAKKEWKPSESPSTFEKKTSESKYYSKFDGPRKPWQKGRTDSKPLRKVDQGSRPYYGKKAGESNSSAASSASKPPYKKFDSRSKPFAKREEVSKFSNKPKSSKGFKMFHKVSGVPKNWPKKDK